MSVVFAFEASEDLQRLGDAIALANPGRAARIVDGLVDACLSLSEMPLRYPLLPRYAAHSIRRRPHGDFLIFYTVADSNVRIVHILHGAMDWEPILFPIE